MVPTVRGSQGKCQSTRVQKLTKNELLYTALGLGKIGWQEVICKDMQPCIPSVETQT